MSFLTLGFLEGWRPGEVGVQRVGCLLECQRVSNGAGLFKPVDEGGRSLVDQVGQRGLKDLELFG